MLSLQVEDPKLKKEVTDFVKTKIKDVKCVDDVHQFCDFQLTEKVSQEEDKLYRELSSLKIILQLSINTYNNYEVYKDGKFKLSAEDHLPPLNDRYFQCGDDGLWGYKDHRDVEGHRNVDGVIEALYRYLICYLALGADNSDADPTSELDVFVLCPFCDGELSKTDISCGQCDATLKEMRAQNNVARKKKQTKSVRKDEIVDAVQKKDEDSERNRDCHNRGDVRKDEHVVMGHKDDIGKWKCGKCECLNKYRSVNCDACGALYREGRWWCGGCTMENSCANYECDTCGTRNANIPKESYINNADRNEGKERPSTRNDTPVVADNKENDSKWTCGKCGCLNKYENANCVACGALYREGRWRCGGCTMENSGANEVCGACGRKNANIDAPTARGAQRGADERNVRCCPKCAVRYETGENACRRCDKQQNREAMDQWECGKCKISVSYGLKVCGGCDSSRAASGRWTCTKCTTVNTFRDSKCTVCYAANECIGVRYCVECGINKAREREERCDDCGRKTSIKYAPIRWKCGYTRCGEMNDDANQYCHKCRLHRLHPRGRGEVVKVSRDGDERVWICVKCGVFNELEDPVCPRCAETRYKKRFCKGCNKYNNGTSTNCDTCHRGFD